MLPNLIPLFIGWFSEYLTIQAVITTLAFPNAPFKLRDHYEYYIFTLMVGEVLGRSYLVGLFFIKAKWAEEAKFPHLWVLAMIQVALLLVFILESWYRFLSSVWIVMLLVFICGLEIGVLYVNALAFFRGGFEDRYREFVMGYIIVAFGMGIFVAALMGFNAEPFSLKHCTTFVNNTDFCFTRSTSLDRWFHFILFQLNQTNM